MKKLIDGRKLPCPQPLILTKKAVEDGTWDIIEITVDNDAAKENLAKYAKYADLSFSSTRDGNGDIIIEIDLKDRNIKQGDKGIHIPEVLVQNQQLASVSITKSRETEVIFLRTDTIGSANRELGLLLMKGFIYTLTELDVKPKTLVFMNDAVRLTVKGSESVENLKNLEKSGVKILVCGTCLDYLGLTSDLETGSISNMYEITETLMYCSSVLTI